MHQNCLLLFAKHAEHIVAGARSVLEIGPDEFPSTLECRCRMTNEGEWHTLDITRRDPAQTFVNDEDNRFPVASDRYDVVLAANVLEHVRMPWVWVRECARVLKPDGFLILITPVSWPYHPAPIDCWRIYPEGMATLLQDAGCEVVLSLFASEEAALHKIAKPVPGLGLDFHLLPGHEGDPKNKKAQLRRYLKKRLASRGLPTQCAYDTIGIGVKKAGTPTRVARNRPTEEPGRGIHS